MTNVAKVKHANLQITTGTLVAFAATAVGAWGTSQHGDAFAVGVLLGLAGVFLGGVMAGIGGTEKRHLKGDE
jgi:hypothetical protein